MIVDERSTCKFSTFHDTKSDMVEPTCEQLHRWKDNGINIKYMRMDNAGENQKLEKRMNSKDWKLNIEPEYTARQTPQQNHLAELAIATMKNRSRAMMIAANIPKELRYKVARKAISCATKVDGLLLHEVDGEVKSRYQHFCRSNPAFADHLRIWGEAGVVTLKETKGSKLSDRGITCMMLDYATNHTGDTYEMWNPNTGMVHVTRDIRWLNRMYYKPGETEVNENETQETGESIHLFEAGESIEVEAQRNDAKVGAQRNDTTTTTNEEVTMDDSSDEQFVSVIQHGDKDKDEEDKIETDEITVERPGRVVRPPKRLIEEMGNISMGELNLAAMAKMELDNLITAVSEPEQAYIEIDEGKTLVEEILATASERDGVIEEEFKQHATQILGEVMAVGAGIGGGFENTNELKVMKFNEAMAAADKDKWENAVDEEHERFVKRRVFEAVLKKDMPAAAKILTTTWAMKKKANGTYRARLDARGFEQEDGKHFDKHDIAAPVTSDITIRVILVIMIIAGWIGELLDICGAFLHGDFKPG